MIQNNDEEAVSFCESLIRKYGKNKLQQILSPHLTGDDQEPDQEPITVQPPARLDKVDQKFIIDKEIQIE